MGAVLEKAMTDFAVAGWEIVAELEAQWAEFICREAQIKARVCITMVVQFFSGFTPDQFEAIIKPLAMAQGAVQGVLGFFVNVPISHEDQVLGHLLSNVAGLVRKSDTLL